MEASLTSTLLGVLAVTLVFLTASEGFSVGLGSDPPPPKPWSVADSHPPEDSRCSSILRAVASLFQWRERLLRGEAGWDGYSHTHPLSANYTTRLDFTHQLLADILYESSPDVRDDVSTVDYNTKPTFSVSRNATETELNTKLSNRRENSSVNKHDLIAHSPTESSTNRNSALVLNPMDSNASTSSIRDIIALVLENIFKYIAYGSEATASDDENLSDVKKFSLQSKTFESNDENFIEPSVNFNAYDATQTARRDAFRLNNFIKSTESQRHLGEFIPAAGNLSHNELEYDMSTSSLDTARKIFSDAFSENKIVIRDQRYGPPAADTPAADAPAADAPTADTPAADTPAADTPAADTPAADTSAADTSAVDTPVADTSAADTSTADTPAADTPAADTSAADTSAADIPAADTPAADTPAADTPAADTTESKDNKHKKENNDVVSHSFSESEDVSNLNRRKMMHNNLSSHRAVTNNIDTDAVIRRRTIDAWDDIVETISRRLLKFRDLFAETIRCFLPNAIPDKEYITQKCSNVNFTNNFIKKISAGILIIKPKKIKPVHFDFKIKETSKSNIQATLKKLEVFLDDTKATPKNSATKSHLTVYETHSHSNENSTFNLFNENLFPRLEKTESLGLVMISGGRVDITGDAGGSSINATNSSSTMLPQQNLLLRTPVLKHSPKTTTGIRKAPNEKSARDKWDRGISDKEKSPQRKPPKKKTPHGNVNESSSGPVPTKPQTHNYLFPFIIFPDDPETAPPYSPLIPQRITTYMTTSAPRITTSRPSIITTPTTTRTTTAASTSSPPKLTSIVHTTTRPTTRTTTAASTFSPPKLTSIVHTTTRPTTRTTTAASTSSSPKLTSIIHSTTRPTTRTTTAASTSSPPKLTSIVHSTTRPTTLPTIHAAPTTRPTSRHYYPTPSNASTTTTTSTTSTTSTTTSICSLLDARLTKVERLQRAVELLLLSLPASLKEIVEAAADSNIEEIIFRPQGRSILSINNGACAECFMRDPRGRCRKVLFCKT